MRGVEWTAAPEDILETSKHRAGTFGIRYHPAINGYLDSQMTL
jgi:hypothetical protein